MEPGLTTIKEKAKKAINEILGTPWVQEVLVTEVVFEAN
jgi:flagellar basal body-associated protein FliL